MLSIKALLKNDYFVIFVFAIIYVVIRSIHFTEFLDFSGDQGEQSFAALNIFRNHTLTLIGPAITSHNIGGHTLFYSSLIYYFQLLFLYPGGFSPVMSSYIFMLFSAFMIIPLYFGTRKLINKPAAITITIIYSLFPMFIDYSRFLWNPNYQLALSTILIYFISKIRDGKRWIFISAFWSGVLVQFHYMFILAIIALLILGIIKHKTIRQSVFLIILGFTIGIAPLWISELKNHFYTIQTLMFYLKTISNPGSGVNISAYYFLTTLLFVFIMVLYLFRKKLNFKLGIIIFFFLLTIDLVFYVPNPTHGFGMTENWNYQDEAYTNLLIQRSIKNNNINKFNVINLSYNTTAYAQKYLLLKSNITIDWGNYYQNDYLFIIDNSNKDYTQDPAYEISSFNPRKQIDAWQINPTHYLYLIQRFK